MNVCARGDGSFLIGGSRLEMRRVETCLPPATQEAKSASKNFGKSFRAFRMQTGGSSVGRRGVDGVETQRK
jgi:hypothetical protein